MTPRPSGVGARNAAHARVARSSAAGVSLAQACVAEHLLCKFPAPASTEPCSARSQRHAHAMHRGEKFQLKNRGLRRLTTPSGELPNGEAKHRKNVARRGTEVALTIKEDHVSRN